MEEDKLKEDIERVNLFIQYANFNGVVDFNDYISNRDIEAFENILNELERLQKENNDLRAIKETVRYLEEAGVKDDLYYVVGRGSYLAKVLENAQDFEKTVHTCLHCGKETPLYCEKCYQELISKNAELQLGNEELKKYEEYYKEQNEVNKKFIPKQVIRDKLDQLKDCDTSCLVEQIYNNGKKSLCKELLGE